MAQFDNGFTGKGTGIVLPSGQDTQRSQERMSDMVINAEKLRYDVFRKNQEDFVKASHIDPAFVISQSAREYQQTLIDDFNKRWGGKMRQYNGNLPTDELVKMAGEKSYVQMEQNKLKSNMELAMAAREDVQRDVRGDLDKDDFTRRWTQFSQTGDWDASPLMPSKLDLDEYLNRNYNKLQGNQTEVSTTVKQGNNLVTVKKKASGSEDDAKNYVSTLVLGNDRIARDVIEKFQALKETDPKTYLSYLDTNKDNKVSAQEERASQSIGRGNPILRWAQDNYWQKALELQDIEQTKPQTTRTTEGRQSAEIEMGGSRIYYQPAERQVATFANRNYSTYHAIPKWPIQNIPPRNITVIDEDGETQKVNTTLEVTLTGYDDKTDEFTFIAENDYDGRSGKGKQIIIKGSEVPPKFNEIKLLVNGVLTTVGEIRKGQTTSAPIGVVTDLRGLFPSSQSPPVKK